MRRLSNCDWQTAEPRSGVDNQRRLTRLDEEAARGPLSDFSPSRKKLETILCSAIGRSHGLMPTPYNSNCIMPAASLPLCRSVTSLHHILYSGSPREVRLLL